ncbi:MAG: PhoU domain-containing protein [Actinomycetota bacterium]
MEQTTDRGSALTPHATFDRELASLESAVQAQAEQVAAILEATIDRLASDRVDAAAVDAEDDAVDQAHVAIEQEAILMIARRQPVAGDLRHILALLRTALHLERIADGAVDVAGLLAAHGPVPSDRLREVLGDMVRLDLAMIETALRSLHDKDQGVALEVEEIHRDLERRRAEAFELITAGPADSEQLPLLLSMDRIGRVLERAGEHAVDIAEEAWFLATGESREFGRAHAAD